MFGEPACFVVTHEAGDRCTGARQNTQDVADDPRTRDGRSQSLDIGAAQKKAAREFGCFRAFLNRFFSQDQNLRHREQSDQRAGNVDTVVQRSAAHHEAFNAFHRVHTDGRNQETQDAGDETF